MRDPQNGRFQPGESGNPANRHAPGFDAPSRLRASRRRLHAVVVDTVYNHFIKCGEEVLGAVCQHRRSDYLRAVISLVPREIKVEHGDEMTYDQLMQRLHALAAELGFTLGLVEGSGAGVPALPAPARWSASRASAPAA